MTVLSMIQENSHQHPERFALTASGESITYLQFWDGINNTAGNLISLGVSPGDRILLSTRPSIESITFAMGATAMGATIVFVGLHDFSIPWDRRLELVKPDYVVADAAIYALNTFFFKKKAAKMNLSMPDYTLLQNVGFFHVGKRMFGTPRSSVSAQKLAYQKSTNSYSVSGDEPAVIVFVPDSEEGSNAVVHSLNSVSAGIPEALMETGLNSLSKAFTSHFMFGLAVLCGGGWWSIPQHNPKLETAGWFKELSASQWTHSFMIPADIVTMLDCINLEGIYPEVENIFTGAAPVLSNLIIRAGVNMPRTRFHSIYGMNEVFPVSITSANEKLFSGKHDYAGHPMMSCEISIQDPNEDGIGEIIIAGSSLMLGYLGEPPAKYHDTGDLGMLTEGGSLLLLGRKRDAVKKDSRKIYPGIYEPLIEEIDGIYKAVIVGVEENNSVVLFVVGENHAVEGLERILPKLFSEQDLPDVTVQIDSIPHKGRSLKPDRAKLRELASANPYIKEIHNNRKEQL